MIVTIRDRRVQIDAKEFAKRVKAGATDLELEQWIDWLLSQATIREGYARCSLNAV